jgi:hypothetical protein
MTEYIEKDAALQSLMKNFLEESWDGCQSEEYRIARETIFSIPTANVVPVKTSRWIKNWCDNDMIGHEYEECENCSCTIVDTEKFWDAKFCPNCGSKMTS